METRLTLSIESDEETNEVSLTAPLANTLLGSLKAPGKADYKEELTDSLMNKYL